jgi:hypothetical protein
MAIYELKEGLLIPLPRLTFLDRGPSSALPFQRLSRDYIEAIAPGTRVVSSAYFQPDGRGEGVLAVDGDANLVLVQFEHDHVGAQMELRALRLATLASSLTFARVATLYSEYLRSAGDPRDAAADLLTFLGWSEADEARFGLDVRIVLVAADFSEDVASAVVWLNENGLDIRCVRLQPYAVDGRVVLDIQQVLPGPETPRFRDQVRHRERAARASDLTQYNVKLGPIEHEKLASRWAIWHSIKNLVDAGVSPCLRQLVLRSAVVVKDGIYVGGARRADNGAEADLEPPAGGVPGARSDAKP